MRNLRGSRVLPAAIVIVVLAGLYGLPGVWRPVSLSSGSAPHAPRVVAVSSVTRACPAPGAGSSAGSGVAVMAAPAGTVPGTAGGSAGSAAIPGAATGSGAAVVTRLSGAGAATAGPPVLSITQPGAPRLATVTTDRTGANTGRPPKPAANTVASAPATGGVVVQASGVLAQGLDVEQTSGTSVPTAACGSPGTDFWFVGPGQRTTQRIQLYLMNTSGQVADADVEIFTDAGPLQQTTDTGITVPAHGMIVQSLAPTLNNSRAITLHVRTSVGQVVAAVQESTGPGPGAWLPAAQAPAAQLVIPGLPNVAGSRELYVAVPGIKDATIQVTAVTSRGTYQPTGTNGIDLPGGSAAEIALPSLSGIPAALKLTANTPITADIMIPGGTGGSPGSFTAATPPIQEQGVVAVNLAGPARASALVLSAPRGTASVDVTQIAAGAARQPPQVVQVAAGHSVFVPLRAMPGAARGAPFAVVITPLAGSGPVYAGRVITAGGIGGAIQAMLPVASAVTTVPLPPVQDAAITTVP